MKWSYRLGRLAEIDIYVHATFFLLLAYFGWVYWVQTGTAGGVVLGLSLIVALFFCVVLHELGHALAARRYGIGTKYITLLPIGGVAMLEKMPEDPWAEVVVALAGPAVNVAIAIGLWLLLSVLGQPGSIINLGLVGGGFLQTLLFANIVLVIFNMIPAFPMDGGRVLRAMLALRLDRVQATRTAATVGQVLAVGLGILGLFFNPFLILIAVFVWIGASAEASTVEMESSLDRRPIRAAMITDFQVLRPDQTLADAVELTLAGSQKDFPVVHRGTVVGVITQADMLRALRDQGPNGPIHEAMTGPPAFADIHASLTDMMTELRDSETRMVCVLDHGRLAGIVNMDNISEFLRIQEALRQHG